ncbi:unannotated protein [freshwater metagenome]|uniref:Unannotated protein n=1 Tax=freshwater metagenome TaxID=449393 RepID=A0A6J6PQU5_9ZZZZ
MPASNSTIRKSRRVVIGVPKRSPRRRTISSENLSTMSSALAVPGTPLGTRSLIDSTAVLDPEVAVVQMGSGSVLLMS